MRPRWLWLRVSPAIRSFILGEVERQYHPIGTLEYAVRVEWLTDAWIWAQEQAQEHHRPTIGDMLELAAMIEPDLNQDGFRLGDVYIGGHLGAAPGEIAGLVARLWTHISDVVPEQGRSADLGGMTADEFYLEFEAIHPFGDGNGRTGKVLHNWLLGTLDDPVLIHDYFGGGGNP